MLNKTRRWCVESTESTALVERLTQHTWTLCTGFECPPDSGVYWLNDSITGDGLQEYAVVRRLADGAWEQIETFTVSWSTSEELESAIAQFAQPECRAEIGRIEALRIDTRGEHGICWHCC